MSEAWGRTRVAHTKSPPRVSPSLIIPQLGRLRRPVGCSRPDGQAQPRVSCGIQILSPPAQAPPASRIRRLPTTRLCALLAVGATYRSIRVTNPATGRARQGHEGQGKHLVLPAENFRGSWITFVGGAGHSGPTGLHNGPGVMVLDIFFHFRIDGGPNRPVVSSTPRSAFCCLWSMTGLFKSLRQCRPRSALTWVARAVGCSVGGTETVAQPCSPFLSEP
jgi:hypothetical protein